VAYEQMRREEVRRRVGVEDRRAEAHRVREIENDVFD
jgi:hypothetical protein